MNQPIQLYFYVKEHCHLCEKMAIALQAFVEKNIDKYCIEIIVRDIEDNQSWYEQFWEYIPAIVINDEEVCNYFFDEEELVSYIRTLAVQ